MMIELRRCCGLSMEGVMRRILVFAFIAVLSLGNCGCLINIWSPDPNERMAQLLNTSEGLRQIKDEWNRFWFLDQPSHLTPIRVHGGIGPGGP